MTEVTVRKGEPVDRALKRLKNKLDTEGIMDDIRRLRSFETPVQRYRRKAKANAKRAKVKVRFIIPHTGEYRAAKAAKAAATQADAGIENSSASAAE